MNDNLLPVNQDINIEVKSLLENIDNIKTDIDLFSAMIEKNLLVSSA